MPAPAAATGIGSLPGTDSLEWSRIIAGELSDFAHVPELPARGPGADVIGRTAALLAAVSPDLAVETTPTGWRFADAPGRSMSRARSWLAEDLDGVEQALSQRATTVKSQLAGPWTLAAAIEMRNGERAVRDVGACRDIAGALAEAVALHLRDLQRRLPLASLVMQIDEPALPAVLSGGVSTASGLATYRAVDEVRAQTHLSVVLQAARDCDALPGVHCCDGRAPIDLLRRSGADMLSIDLTVLQRDQEESLGAALDSGALLLLGVVPALRVATSGPPERVMAEDAARRVLEQFARWGFSAEAGADRAAITPRCGLAGTDAPWARTVYLALREAGRLVRGQAVEAEESV